MQSSRALVTISTQENISEKHLKIFYRNSSTQRTQRSRQRILRNFRTYTGEQAEMFERMFEVVYFDSCSRLKRKHPSLSIIERIIVEFLHMELAEAKITRNMGLTIEELRRHVFNISKKLKTSPINLPKSVHKILQ